MVQVADVAPVDRVVVVPRGGHVLQPVVDGIDQFGGLPVRPDVGFLGGSLRAGFFGSVMVVSPVLPSGCVALCERVMTVTVRSRDREAQPGLMPVRNVGIQRHLSLTRAS